MKRILGLAMTLALVLVVTATSFAGVSSKGKSKPAAKSAVMLKNKSAKPHKHRKHRRHWKHRHGRRIMKKNNPK